MSNFLIWNDHIFPDCRMEQTHLSILHKNVHRFHFQLVKTGICIPYEEKWIHISKRYGRHCSIGENGDLLIYH